MSAVEKLRQASEQFKLLDLPIGAYIVTREGDFVDCNDQVRKILQIAPDTLPKSIKDFYYDGEERDDFLHEIELKLQVNPDEWMEKIIRLRIGGRDKFIKDNSRAIFDPGTNKAIGFLCCMTEVTREQSYNRLYTSLPIGLYKLDENDRIVEINKAAVEMLGYDSSDEIESKEIGDFFADAEEKGSFRKLVHDEGEAADQKVELLKRDGESMFVSLSAYRVPSSDNEYVGQEGSMMDVTNEERYRRLLEHNDRFPVGLYQVKTVDGKDVITHCNKQFATINGFNDIESVIGFDARKLHASDETYKAYMTALKESGEEPLHDYLLDIRTRKGKEATFEVNTQMLFDRNDNPVGRAGAMRDISEKAKFKKKVDDLTKDIGGFLHTYSTSLVRMQISIGLVRQSLEPDPFHDTYNLLPERASEELLEPTKRLVKSINDLIKMSTSAWGSEALSAESWQRLGELSELFQTYQASFPAVQHSPTLRTASFRVLDILDNIQKGKLARDSSRQVRRDTRDLLRVCNLTSLHQLLDGIMAMEHPVFALREFVTADKRQNEERKVAKISSLISQTTHNMNDFAINRGVSFRFKIGSPDAQVEVNEREVVRAFDNLLHNAIKYSWERRKGEPPWIHIRVHTSGRQVFIEFENWGVPIPEDEIKKGLIYRTGFRGRFSSDRGRVGTGIGLADAQQVAHKHDGDVIIKSDPAFFGKPREDYKQPFITTATVILPLFVDEGART